MIETPRNDEHEAQGCLVVLFIIITLAALSIII